MSSINTSMVIERVSSFYNRTSLGCFPTPVESVTLNVLPQEISFFIKRDDFSSSVYGGNKTRKLEFLLEESARPVLTFGPLGSHHVLSTALHAKAMGRRCAALLVPQSMTPHHEEIHQAIIEACDPVVKINANPLSLGFAAWSLLPSVLSFAPYEICPPGGTSPLGTLGFVLGGLELASQVKRGEMPEPKKVFVPLGTGGTAVGIAIGLAMAGLQTETVAVRVVPKAALPAVSLNILQARTVRLVLKAMPELTAPKNIRLRIDNRFYNGYAKPSAPAQDALRYSLKAGVDLETTYSANAMAALMDEMQTHGEDDGPYLFWQTFAHLKTA